VQHRSKMLKARRWLDDKTIMRRGGPGWGLARPSGAGKPGWGLQEVLPGDGPARTAERTSATAAKRAARGARRYGGRGVRKQPSRGRGTKHRENLGATSRKRR